MQVNIEEEVFNNQIQCFITKAFCMSHTVCDGDDLGEFSLLFGSPLPLYECNIIYFRIVTMLPIINIVPFIWNDIQ